MEVPQSESREAFYCRIREGLTYFDHSSGPLQTELSLGKFTILPCRDPNGAAIALFNLSHHEPSEVTHQTVLQCVVFQVTAASLLLQSHTGISAGRGPGGD